MSIAPKGCFINFMRGFLVVYNTLFLFVGNGLVAMGTLMITQYKNYIASLGPDLSIIPMLVIFLGGVILMVSVLGIVGGILPNSCVLICYSGLLLLIMIGELALGIATVTGQEQVQHKAEVQIVRAMTRYNSEVNTRFGIDLFQKTFNCCGVMDYRDWRLILGKSEVPASCCADSTNCTGTYNTTAARALRGIHTRGCLHVFSIWARSNVGLVAGVVLGACTLQILGLLFGFVLAYRVRGTPYAEKR